MTTCYLDTSALVKLAVREAHSDSLRELTRTLDVLATSALARTELRRAVTRFGATARTAAEGLLEEVHLVPLTDPLLDQAGALRVPEVPFLRSLDAIHLVSARLLPDVEVVTYDERMADAARAVGLAVVTPRD